MSSQKCAGIRIKISRCKIAGFTYPVLATTSKCCGDFTWYSLFSAQTETGSPELRYCKHYTCILLWVSEWMELLFTWMCVCVFFSLPCRLSLRYELVKWEREILCMRMSVKSIRFLFQWSAAYFSFTNVVSFSLVDNIYVVRSISALLMYVFICICVYSFRTISEWFSLSFSWVLSVDRCFNSCLPICVHSGFWSYVYLCVTIDMRRDDAPCKQNLIMSLCEIFLCYTWIFTYSQPYSENGQAIFPCIYIT